MTVSLADLKSHLVIEHPHDDDTLTRCLLAAESHLGEISVKEALGPNDPRSPSYDIAVLMVAGALFHDREGGTDAPSRESLFSVARLVAPLRCPVA